MWIPINESWEFIHYVHVYYITIFGTCFSKKIELVSGQIYMDLAICRKYWCFPYKTKKAKKKKATKNQPYWHSSFHLLPDSGGHVPSSHPRRMTWNQLKTKRLCLRSSVQRAFKTRTQKWMKLPSPTLPPTTECETKDLSPFWQDGCTVFCLHHLQRLWEKP